MRTTTLLIIALLFGAASAQADTKVFILGNDADGYGIDRCLATGAACGAAMASAICRSREYKQALSFGKIDRDEITGSVPKTDVACPSKTCDDYVAIACTR
jgi:hypothetical protein